MNAFLLMLAQALAIPQPEPYAPAPHIGTAERLAWAAERGGPRDDDAIGTWLRQHPNAPAPLRAMLLHRLCNDYGVRIGGQKRIDACRGSVALTGNSEDANDLKLALTLRDIPPLTASGGATIPLTLNPLGIPSASLTVKGISVAWIMDTGAEISVLSESTAAKLGVRVVGDSLDVGTATSDTVTGKVGIVDEVRIGTATISNLPVLILPDAMLTITKDYTIPGIFGLPGLVALGRVAWLDGGRRMAVGKAAPMPGEKAAHVYWHEDGLGIPLSTARGVVGIQLDSGADSMALTTAGTALLDSEQLARAEKREVAVGGAGGVVRSTVRVLPRLDYSVAGTPLKAVGVNLDGSGNGTGKIGNDMIKQLKLLTIDFSSMTLSAVPLGAK